MRVNAYWFLMILLACVHTNAKSSNAKGFVKYPLEQFTKLELKVYSLLGTQLSFPFILGDPALKPALKIKNTSPDAFEVPHSQQELNALVKDQSTITIVGIRDDGNNIHRGNLFITVGGYHISIDLITTYKPEEHITNVIFELSDEKREYMLEDMIKSRIGALEKEYQVKLSSMNKTDINANPLAKIARIKPSSTRFKVTDDMEIDGSRLEVFIDKGISYKDLYHSLLFEVDNKSSNDFLVSRVEFVSLANGVEKTLMGTVECPEKIKADERVKCAFVTSDSTLIKSGKLRFDMMTDRGRGSLVW